MASKPETWSIRDHLCKSCGGRILQRESGPSVMTSGGNPIFRCSDCGKQTSSMDESSLCWCGFKYRGQYAEPYICVAFDKIETYPKLRQVFLNHGCDPSRKTSQIGIMTEKEYLDAIKEV